MKRYLTLGAFGLLSAAALFVWQQADHSINTTLPAGAVSAEQAASDAAKTDSAEAAPVDKSGIIEMVQGPEDAKVTLTEYASFTCPHCAHFHEEVYPKLKKNYIDTGKIRFIYRDVYFDKFGLWAAMLARCDGPMRFFGISDMLFDQQPDWLKGDNAGEIAANLRKIGKVAGMSEDQVNACLEDNDKAKALVTWYQENAQKDEITGTPSLIINGEKFSNMSYDELAAILDKKLAE